MGYNKVTVKASRVQRQGKGQSSLGMMGNFLEQVLFKLGFDET